MDHTKDKIILDLKEALDEQIAKEEEIVVDVVAEAEAEWPPELIAQLKEVSEKENIPYEEVIRMYNVSLKAADPKSTLGKKVTPEQEAQIQAEYDEYVRDCLAKMSRKQRRVYLANQKTSGSIKQRLKAKEILDRKNK